MKCIGLSLKRCQKYTVVRSRSTRKIRPSPYFDVPDVRGWCRTCVKGNCVKPKSILLHLALKYPPHFEVNEWQLWVRDGSIANLMQTCTSVCSDQQQGDPSLALVIRWPHNKHNIILEPAWGTIHNIKQQRIWKNNPWIQKKGVQRTERERREWGFWAAVVPQLLKWLHLP